MRKKSILIALALVAALVLVSYGVQAQEPLQAGDKVGEVSFVAPSTADDLAYLGLEKGAKGFKIGQVKAPVVVVQLFSMYCTYCQEEAPQVNEFFDLTKQKGLREKIKIFGVGMKNSQMETDLFRNKFKVMFPLLADPDGTVHATLGSPMTPFFLVVDNREGGKILFTHLGAMPSAESFLQSIIDKAGLK